MKSLLQLVRKYLAAEIDYSAFRRAMVVDFQSTDSADPSIQGAVDAIADACFEFSEKLISEEQLRRKVVCAFRTGQTNVENIVLCLLSSEEGLMTPGTSGVEAKAFAAAAGDAGIIPGFSIVNSPAIMNIDLTPVEA